MIRFMGPLDLRVYTAEKFVVLADLRVRFDNAGCVYEITIPRGLITDFASVPKALSVIPNFDANGDSRIPAALHDYLYSENGKIRAKNLTSDVDVNAVLTRDECDQLLHDGMIVMGVPKFVADAFYRGVRFGGQSHWDDAEEVMDFVPSTFWGTV